MNTSQKIFSLFVILVTLFTFNGAAVQAVEVVNINSKNIVAQLGDKGPTVQYIQAFLRFKKYIKGGIDSKYGQKTKKAVMAFQKKESLRITGIVDEETKKLMDKQLDDADPTKHQETVQVSPVVTNSGFQYAYDYRCQLKADVASTPPSQVVMTPISRFAFTTVTLVSPVGCEDEKITALTVHASGLMMVPYSNIKNITIEDDSGVQISTTEASFNSTHSLVFNNLNYILKPGVPLHITVRADVIATTNEELLFGIDKITYGRVTVVEQLPNISLKLGNKMNLK